MLPVDDDGIQDVAMQCRGREVPLPSASHTHQTTLHTSHQCRSQCRGQKVLEDNGSHLFVNSPLALLHPLTRRSSTQAINDVASVEGGQAEVPVDDDGRSDVSQEVAGQAQHQNEPSTENVRVGAEEDVDEDGDAATDQIQPHQQVRALVLYLDRVHFVLFCVVFAIAVFQL